MAFQNQKKSPLEFSQIVFEHIQSILKISCVELKDKTQTIITQGSLQTTFQEDSRISYIQAVENLEIIINPYFDEESRKISEECVEILNKFNFEVKEKFEKEYEEATKNQQEKLSIRNFGIEMKVRYSKKLFKAIINQLKKSKFLKESLSGEISTDELEDEE